MANREHTLMHAMEPPRRDPLIDDLGMELEICQLPQRHHPVLSRGQLGNLPVRGASLPLMGRFSSI